MKRTFWTFILLLVTTVAFAEADTPTYPQRQILGSDVFPEHVVGRVMDNNGQVLQEFPSNFIYENGELKRYLFPFMEIESSYEFNDYPSKPSLVTTTYHASQPALVEDLQFLYQNGMISRFEQLWSDVNRDLFTDYFYDDHGHTLKQEFSDFYGCYMRYVFEYQDNYRTRIESHFSANDFVNFKISSKTTSYYDENYQMTSSQTESYDNDGNIIRVEKKTYTRTPNRKTDTIITQTLINDEWQNTAFIHYVYDDKGRIIQYQTGVWLDELSAWDMDHQILYDFDDEAQKLIVSFRKKTNDQWEWDYFTNQKLFYDSYLNEWQRTLRHYGSMTDYRINQFEIDLRNGFSGIEFPWMSEWYYKIEWELGSVTFQHLEYASDTTIHETRPKIIVRSNTHYDRNFTTEVTHEYIYEENSKVYWWNKELQKYTLLYDFGASVGDEWEIEVGTESVVVHVESIGAFDYQEETRRMLHISDANDMFTGDIVEGLGHLTSFFPEKLMDSHADYSVNGLRCFWEKEIMLYHNGEEDCDAVYNQIHTVEEQLSDDFVLCPNPAWDVVVVETRAFTSLQPTQSYLPYHITNMVGQTIQQGNLDLDKPQISMKNLSPGLYILNIDNQCFKFVKQ